MLGQTVEEAKAVVQVGNKTAPWMQGARELEVYSPSTFVRMRRRSAVRAIQFRERHHRLTSRGFLPSEPANFLSNFAVFSFTRSTSLSLRHGGGDL